jgi:hypothetical protein
MAGSLVAAGMTMAFVGGISTSNSPSKARPLAPAHDKLSAEELAGNGGEPATTDGDSFSRLAQEAYRHRAYPAGVVAISDTLNAQNAWSKIKGKSAKAGANSQGQWSLIGPSNAQFPAVLTFAGHDYVTSGRVTALAIAPNCSQSKCRVYAGAAGGGIWRTDNALSGSPNWTFVSDSFATNAIGTITLDPSDPTGNIVYVGTGEPNGSGDSNAGLGIYKSTDGGNTWTHLAAATSVAGASISCGVNTSVNAYSGPAFDFRSISSIIVSGSTLYVGSARGVLGDGVPSGGSFTQNPNFPPVGLWKSTDGGANFTLIGSPVPVCNNPLLPGGAFISSFGSLRGVNDVAFDPSTTSTLYVGVFGRGIRRSTDSGATFAQIFKPASSSSADRTSIAVTHLSNGKTRIYAGDGANSPTGTALYRTDDATQAASGLFDGTNNTAAWQSKTSSDRLNPYYGTFNYCTTQCVYDNLVVSPPGHPDEIYVGGSYQYSEYGFRSNGRGVVRSTDAGEHWSDMTWDATTAPNSPPNCCNPNPISPNGLHPDQHALVVNPNNSGEFIEGSDGGLIHSSGQFADISSQCDDRFNAGLIGSLSRTACRNLLSAVPSHLFSSNKGLSTLQFSTLSVDPTNPKHLQGGTQDNGTFETYGSAVVWPQIIYGDGGESGFDIGNPAIRFNQFFLGATDTNFQNGDPTKWVVTSGPLLQSGEGVEFYWAEINDPNVPGTMYTGFQHVWRTLDNGGNQAYLEANCPEFTASAADPACGDWVPLGGTNGDLTTSFWGDRDSTLGFPPIVSQVERFTGDNGTLWAATDSGRLFVTYNANAANQGDVSYTRVDSLASNDPERFISSIYIDPANKNHVWVSYSGYNAHTPATPGHVFEVTFNPGGPSATWTDRSYDLADLPITDLVRDDRTGDLYASSDFGVMKLANGATSWTEAGGGLPKVEVSSLTIVPNARLLYAATHGRSAWKLNLP